MSLSYIRKALGSFGVFAASFFIAPPAFAELGQPTPWGMGFQEAASPMKIEIEHFHNAILMPVITVITLFVLLLLIIVVGRFNAKKNPKPSTTTHNVPLEFVWTVIPIIILVAIWFPSMKMLYYLDKTPNPEMTLKVTGYQWYWGYEYPDHGGVNFLANMLQEDELKEGQPRLLGTDNAIVLPVDTDIQILVTASDVLHAFAVPSLGIKIDAVPGRTNETWVRIDKEGTLYGQCSELCGTNHAFMPIEIRAVSKEAFAKWVKEQGGTMPNENKAAVLDAPASSIVVSTTPVINE